MPGDQGALWQKTLIPVEDPDLNIVVETRLRSLYLMLATMGRVNHA